MHWSRPAVSGELPPPLSKHTTTLVGSKLFTFGINEKEKSKFIGRPWIFDTETMHWSRPEVSGTLPESFQLKAHTAAAVGKKIFMFGGGDTNSYFDKLLVFDTETNIWSSPETSGDQPSSRRALCSAVVGDCLYIFGGGDGQTPLDDLFSLNLKTLFWKKYPKKGKNWPTPRGYQSCTPVNDKLYILGGSNISTCFSDGVVFDTERGSWTPKTFKESKCRYAHSASLVGPYIFVFGGCDGFKFVNTLELLNLKTGVWEKPTLTGTPPPERGYHTANFHDNRLFVIGGTAGDKVFGDVYILDLGVYAYLSLRRTEPVRESRKQGRSLRAQSVDKDK